MEIHINFLQCPIISLALNFVTISSFKRLYPYCSFKHRDWWRH